MTSSSQQNWSPADNPYAIAVSQSQLWRDVVRLTVLRMRDEDDRRAGWFSSRQLDAHVLIMTLRQLLTAEQLEQAALTELGIDPAVSAALAEARQRFVTVLPGIKDMRDALMHFDQWAQGTGRGPQAKRRRAGDAVRDIARDYWRFGFDPNTGVVSFGPYSIDIDVAAQAANDMCRAIYVAAHEVDKKNTAERRMKIIDVLTDAGISHNAPDALVRVSPGTDLRIWLSLDPLSNVDEGERRQVAERVVNVLTAASMQLESTNLAVTLKSADRLMQGETLRVVANTYQSPDTAGDS